KENIFTIDTINLHDFGIDNRKSVDDEPFGGGPGMILRPDVVEKALFSISKKQSLNSAKIYLTPSGTLLNQKKLGYLSKLEEIIILCGRFEGVDQRAIDILGFEEISIGDYVLAGGEIAAQVLLEGCIRLIPGVLGHPESLLEESFSNNLLEYPQYTRPQVWEDSQGNKHDVPEVLTSGHHGNIKKWRQDKSVDKTKKIRPDLIIKKEQEQD
ncbi:MAG: tRNA (guanosine(37)-N1)-methyltransferase TrmD, partial [Pelagibacteraceae bacterium]|nr:tRNA (guanosine(37)-N1)-methyltransferase TrmD [Pelagibacteraceae bacterium]